jgi:molybdate transport system substrate-binding protein
MKIRTILIAICAVTLSHAARADEIKLLASGAMHEIGNELLPLFEKSSGHKVTATWTGTVKIKQQVAAGEAFDLVIVGAPEVDAFIADGKMKPGSRVDLARSGVGVAVRAGAPKPDIGSGEAVKRALLAAKSVVYSTGPSGVYVAALFEKLGIAEQMKAKTTRTAPGTRVGQALAKGEGDLGFQQISELIHETGIDFLGPLPPDIQHFTLYSSGIVSASKVPSAAAALQAFLTTPEALAVIRKNGMEPGR